VTAQVDMGDDAVSRARELVLAGRYKRAIALLRQHLDAHPDDAVAWHRLSGALTGADDPGAALAAADRSIAVDAENAVAHRYRALACSLLRRDADHYAAAERSVALDPEQPDALSLLASAVVLVDGDRARARELVRSALALSPDNRPALALAEALEVLPARHTAVAVVTLTLLPATPVLLFGWFAVDTGRVGDALWLLIPGLLALAICNGAICLVRSTRRRVARLRPVSVVSAAAAAGALTFTAGFAAVGAVPPALGLGLTAVALSALLGGLSMLRRRELDASAGLRPS
jgi:tetratricopeptide (TPR) repeat protein